MMPITPTTVGQTGCRLVIGLAIAPRTVGGAVWTGGGNGGEDGFGICVIAGQN